MGLLSFFWWSYFAEPMMQNIEARQADNRRIADQVEQTCAIVREVRQRLAAGVYQEKEQQLARLSQELEAVAT